jgi:hypothetical protein
MIKIVFRAAAIDEPLGATLQSRWGISALKSSSFDCSEGTQSV